MCGSGCRDNSVDPIIPILKNGDRRLDIAHFRVATVVYAGACSDFVFKRSQEDVSRSGIGRYTLRYWQRAQVAETIEFTEVAWRDRQARIIGRSWKALSIACGFDLSGMPR